MSNIIRLLKVLYAMILSPLLWLTYTYAPKLHKIITKPTVSGRFDEGFQDFVVDKVRKLDRREMTPEQFIRSINQEMCLLVETGKLKPYLREDIEADQNLDVTLLTCEGYTPFKRWYVKLHYMA